MKEVITLAEARKLNLKEWDMASLDEAEKLSKEVAKFMPCTVEVRMVTDSSTPTLFDVYIVLQTEPFRITITFKDQYKKYMLFAYFTDLNHVDTDYQKNPNFEDCRTQQNWRTICKENK